MRRLPDPDLAGELFQAVPCVVYVAEADKSGRTLFVNQYIDDMLGYSVEEWMEAPGLWFDSVHEQDRAHVEQVLETLSANADPVSYTYRIRHRNGGLIWARDEVRLAYSEHFGREVLVGTVTDITAQEKVRQDLEESEARYRDLFDANPIPMWIYDVKSLRFLAVNDAAVHHYGYSRHEFLSMTIVDIRPPKDVSRLLQHVANVRERLDDAGQWRHVTKSGDVIDVDITSHTLIYEGRRAEAVSAIDVTEVHKAEKESLAAHTRLKRAFDSTVEIFSRTVEARDPYTAGHDSKVGQLAAAIGTEMALSDAIIEGLYACGSLHDVGKLSVPADILTYPGKLTDTAHALARGHAEAGHRILKHVDCPWPVAEVARQHHERLDGTGYPNGLKGDQIILEARIVAVADVFDSMTSHRPYRPALGVENALEELSRFRGVKLDRDAVDAVIRLVREKNYPVL